MLAPRIIRTTQYSVMVMFTKEDVNMLVNKQMAGIFSNGEPEQFTYNKMKCI